MPRELFPIILTMVIGLCVIGYPLARAYARRLERGTASPRLTDDLAERIARIEHTVEAIAIEVERISEGQRFTTRVLTEERSTRIGAGSGREAP